MADDKLSAALKEETQRTEAKFDVLLDDYDWSDELIKHVKERLEENKRFNTHPHGMKRPVDFKVVGQQYGHLYKNDMWYDCTAVRQEMLPQLSVDDLVSIFCRPGIDTIARALVESGPTRIGYRPPVMERGHVKQRVYQGKIPIRLTIQFDYVYAHTKILFDVRAWPLDEERGNFVAENKNIVRLNVETPFSPAGIVRVDATSGFNPEGVVAMAPTREIREEDWEWAP